MRKRKGKKRDLGCFVAEARVTPHGFSGVSL
jgi:hypothetical protein